MKNVPQTIYLQVGPDTPEDFDFEDLMRKEVTWCADNVFKTDIKYCLHSDKDKEIAHLKYRNRELITALNKYQKIKAI